MALIRKSSLFQDIPSYDKEYWWAKSPEERLDAALRLILHAKAIYKANPKNKPPDHGTRIFKSDSPISLKTKLGES